MKRETKIVHQPRISLPSGNVPLVDPVYRSVKFKVRDTNQMEKRLAGLDESYLYSSGGNPTVRKLEEALARTQGTEDGLVTATGVSAISTAAIAMLKSGDAVIFPIESYKSTRFLFQKVLSRYGVEPIMVSITDIEGIKKALARPQSRMIMLESPTNPALLIADLGAISEVAKNEGVLTLLDNTAAGLHAHAHYPIDLYAHSLTKYASGHGDVMGGAILGSNELIGKIRLENKLLCPTIDPHAADLLLRSLKTYFMRFFAQSESAQKVANFLVAHKNVRSVRYPGHPSHPQYELAQQQMDGFGALVTFELKANADINSLIDSLSLFYLSFGFGGVESIVNPAMLFYGREFAPEDKERCGITDQMIRLSIGLEAADDLIEDLNRGLNLLSH